MRVFSLALACFTGSVACTIEEPGAAAEACNGPDCQDAGQLPLDQGPPPAPTLEPSADDDSAGNGDAGSVAESDDAGSAGLLYPVCQGPCQPDDALSCSDYDPRDELETRALYADAASRIVSFRQLTSVGLDAGVSLDASAGVDLGSSGAGPGGHTDDAASAGRPERGESSPDAALMEQVYSCQIDRDEGATAVGCWWSGTGDDGAACASSEDCQPGYGCVDDGHCRKFCCGGDASCVDLAGGGQGHFCDERPVKSKNAEGALAILVPVCAPADMCDLSEPYPCDGPDCKCPGATCTVVNAQGATACMVPGEGQLDQPCPCAAGFYCHPVEQTCKLLCSLEENDGVCGDSLCQATANFPPGWGLCQPVAPEAE